MNSSKLFLTLAKISLISLTLKKKKKNHLNFMLLKELYSQHKLSQNNCSFNSTMDYNRSIPPATPHHREDVCVCHWWLSPFLFRTSFWWSPLPGILPGFLPHSANWSIWWGHGQRCTESPSRWDAVIRDSKRRTLLPWRNLKGYKFVLVKRDSWHTILFNYIFSVFWNKLLISLRWDGWNLFNGFSCLEGSRFIDNHKNTRVQNFIDWS